VVNDRERVHRTQDLIVETRHGKETYYLFLLSLDDPHGDRFFVDREEDLTEPGNLQHRQTPIGNELKVQPKAERLDFGMVLFVLKGQIDVGKHLIGKARPGNDSTNEKGHDKDGRQANLDFGKGVGETRHTLLVVKVGQQTKDGRRNFGESAVKGWVKVDHALEAGNGGDTRKDVVKDKLGAVVKDNRVVEVLDLIGEKEETETVAGRIIRQNPIQVARLGKGFLLATNDPCVESVVLVNTHPAEGRANSATKGVDSNVTSEDPTTHLVLQNRVDILVGQQEALAQAFDQDEEEDEKGSRQGGRRIVGSSRLVGFQRQEELQRRLRRSLMLRGGRLAHAGSCGSSSTMVSYLWWRRGKREATMRKRKNG
jgi:hypothetical protein